MSSTNSSSFPTPSHHQSSRSLRHRALNNRLSLNNLDPYTISNHRPSDFSLGLNYASPYSPQTYIMHYPMQMQQYDVYTRPSSTLLVYDGPVGYVDEVAIISFAMNYPMHMQQFDVNSCPVHEGLSIETILKNLKTSCISKEKGEEEGELCAVCQDEYKVREIIGTLQCGHRYHANCIKDWLLHKNFCPICKATAFARET